MTPYDVVVVGGGPIGAVAARHAVAVGARVLLIERGGSSREPTHCTGLVSPRTLDILGVSTASLLREIRGGMLHAPGGETIELRSHTVKAVVLDRGKLNRELIELATSAGVEVSLHTRAVSACQGWVRVERQGKVETIAARVIIGADGPRSSVASWFSLPQPDQFLAASQAVVARKPRAPDGVEVFFGRDVAPGFFAWAVPAEEDRLRVGLAAPLGNDTEALLSRLLAQRFSGEAVARIGGLIPIGALTTTVGDGVLLVGDAAGQVKPTSGGGIYTGGVCGRIAGEIAGCASLAGETNRQTLAEYERRWQNEIGGELRFGLAAHRVLAALSDQEIDAVFTVLAKPSILQVIAEEGEIDHPSRLLRAFLFRQDLWPKFLGLLPAFGGWKRIEELARLAFIPNHSTHVMSAKQKKKAVGRSSAD